MKKKQSTGKNGASSTTYQNPGSGDGSMVAESVSNRARINGIENKKSDLRVRVDKNDKITGKS